jgi:hypothetical protein
MRAELIQNVLDAVVVGEEFDWSGATQGEIPRPEVAHCALAKQSRCFTANSLVTRTECDLVVAQPLSGGHSAHNQLRRISSTGDRITKY